MKVLLTGAAGRLGSVACDQLHQAGHEIIATDQRLTQDLPVKLHLANLMDLIACLRLAEGIEALVHLGNNPHPLRHEPERVFIENCTINMNVFSAAEQAGIQKIVFASSIQACSGARWRGEGEPAPSQLPYFPLDGDLPANPGNTYGLSKVVGEANLRMLVKKTGSQGTALRFPWLMNLPDVDDRTRRRALWARNSRSSNTDEAFAYLSFRDGARLINHLLEADLPGYRCYLPAAPGNVAQLPMDDLVNEYFKGIPLNMPIEQMTGPSDNRRITAETGWKPTDQLQPLEEPSSSEPV